MKAHREIIQSQSRFQDNLKFWKEFEQKTEPKAGTDNNKTPKATEVAHRVKYFEKIVRGN